MNLENKIKTLTKELHLVFKFVQHEFVLDSSTNLVHLKISTVCENENLDKFRKSHDKIMDEISISFYNMTNEHVMIDQDGSSKIIGNHNDVTIEISLDSLNEYYEKRMLKEWNEV